MVSATGRNGTSVDASPGQASRDTESTNKTGVNGNGTTKAEPAAVNGTFESPYVAPMLKLIDRFVDEPRSLRVAVIGAGIAGITAGSLLPAKVPGIKLTIFEKNADMVSLSLAPGQGSISIPVALLIPSCASDASVVMCRSYHAVIT